MQSSSEFLVKLLKPQTLKILISYNIKLDPDQKYLIEDKQGAYKLKKYDLSWHLNNIIQCMDHLKKIEPHWLHRLLLLKPEEIIHYGKIIRFLHTVSFLDFKKSTPLTPILTECFIVKPKFLDLLLDQVAFNQPILACLVKLQWTKIFNCQNIITVIENGPQTPTMLKFLRTNCLLTQRSFNEFIKLKTKACYLYDEICKKLIHNPFDPTSPIHEEIFLNAISKQKKVIFTLLLLFKYRKTPLNQIEDKNLIMEIGKHVVGKL